MTSTINPRTFHFCGTCRAEREARAAGLRPDPNPNPVTDPDGQLIGRLVYDAFATVPPVGTPGRAEQVRAIATAAVRAKDVGDLDAWLLELSFSGGDWPAEEQRKVWQLWKQRQRDRAETR